MTKRNIPVKMNETYTLSIRDLGIHGEGIGSVEDFTVFVVSMIYRISDVLCN